MCGLSFILSRNPVDRESLTKMNNQIIHRGPDGEGEYYDEISNHYIGMGHRRLAILDLSSSGAQPMITDDLIIIFNGEIFNFIELREQLAKLGHHFQSASDTEVLLKAYLHWGDECLNKLNGMFSFIIVDKRKNQIFFARDRFGIKPLFSYVDKDSIYFFSEIKQILALELFKPSLNHQAAYDFLNFALSDHLEESFFLGIKNIRPGHCGIFHLENPPQSFEIKQRPWYSFLDSSLLSEIDRKKSFFDYLYESVDLRLRSDVLIGSCLSGGLDSSTIVALNAKIMMDRGHTTQTLKTFTSRSTYKQFDESQYSDKLVQSLKIQNYQVFPTDQSLFNSIDRLITIQDEPFGTTSIFAQHEVFRISQENGVKVVLDGQGADEILGGYRTFFKPYLFSLLKKGRLIKLFKEVQAYSKRHGGGITLLLETIILYYFPSRITEFLKNIMGKESTLQPYFNIQYLNCEKANPRDYKSNKIFSVQDQAKFLVEKGNLPMLLRFEDRNSMAHSIEARVPFLDYRIVEFMLAADKSNYINNGETKAVLRQSLGQLLPKEILHRQDKMGFVTAEECWFKENKNNHFINLLEKTVTRLSPLISSKIVSDAKEFTLGKQSYNPLFWRVICLGLWAEKYQVDLGLLDS